MTPSGIHRLADVSPGAEVRIHALRGNPEVSHRLRELGMREDAVLRCLHRAHGNLICEVASARVGINVAIAQDILVSRHTS